MEVLERQELYCHDCNQYVQFDLDVSLNGNHEIICPNCGHEHCRVVRDGRITEIRWDQRNGPAISAATPIYTATNLSTSTASTYDSYSGTTGTGYTDSMTNAQTNYHLYQSWMNTGT